ncbi:carbohydrate ABC transporter permease [Clostridium lacusfryxellense]|uniref:carbohydrate ABC transporter permease n=1 Tax=Clostridium lacusfryxellense TaxID=205328 RepID=UPI001C0E29D3|nr:carbohydrate ABC transporter permease [Clostridium lacusfryxellense]MBU3111246.1 carbohydrate ABC transporter permease [Clostridium lacusfryxellense]
MNMKILNRRTKGEAIFDITNVIIMIIICFLTIYPIWYVVVNSLNDGMDAMLGGIYWWPRKFSLLNYQSVLENAGIVKALQITALKTIIGTAVHVFFTSMVAYSLSKSELIGRKLYMTIGIITMFFSGGLIPTFLLIRNLGMLDKFIVYIIPVAFSMFDLIIFISFFKTIPSSLEEAARIDGANDFYIFLKVIIPLSMPVIATIALFHGVYQWNDYFAGMIYINDSALQPIQTYLYKVIAQSGANQMMQSSSVSVSKSTVTSQSIKFATMVVTTFPIVCVYPFLQKYFVKGMLLGSVKG